MNRLKINTSGANITRYISLLVIVVLVAVITSINPNFLRPLNIKNLLTDMTTFLVMGSGITFVLLIGSIDLSLGGVCSFSAVLCATLLGALGGAGGILLPLLFGILAGLFNGFLFTFVKIPSFIATLGTMSIWNSLALVLSGSGSVSVPRAQGEIFDFTKITVIDIFTVYFLIGAAVVIIAYILLRRTSLGKYIYAIGANEKAARMAGVPIRKTKMFAYVVSAFLSSMMGILLVAKLKSASPYVGDPLTLMCIAAAVLGGVSLSGGRGNALWMTVGCAVVAIIQNGISAVGLDSFYQQIVFGLLLLIAIFITADRSSRNIIIK